MVKVMLKYKLHVIALLVLIIVEPSLNSILNFWLQRLFNSATPGAEKITIMQLLTMGFLLWLLKRLTSFASSVIKARFICTAKQDIKHRMFVNLFGLDTANISQIASSGEYISIFTNDINLLESRFYNQIVGLISGVFSIAILGASFFALNSKLAFAILGFGVFSMFVPVFFARILNRNSLRYSNAISHFTQKLKEYVSAYPTIKNYSVEDTFIRSFNGINQTTEDAKFDADYALTLANNVGQLLAWFMQFIGVGLGLMLVIKGEITVGTVVAAQSFASDLASPLQNLIININSIKSVREIIRKIEKLSGISEGVALSKALAAHDDEGSAAFVGSPNDLVFCDLNLRIGDKQIIHDFSYRFEAGKKYLVIGLNGSGKSSIFKALKKWYPISSGSITLGGRDLVSINSRELSRIVSYLNENVSLFSGSVKDNIVLFRSLDDQAFHDAKESAYVRLDSEREIMDNGVNISSGEQRRIEIARSLLNAVSILIFDEVVSTLDIETAYEIEKLALGFKDKTVIFISHNFSGKLVREYDEILVIDEGRLIAHGPYEQLLASSEYFRRICQIKFGDIIQ